MSVLSIKKLLELAASQSAPGAELDLRRLERARVDPRTGMLVTPSADCRHFSATRKAGLLGTRPSLIVIDDPTSK